MLNEIIFSAHTLLVGCFALLSLRFGKPALVGFISVQCILANLFVLKQTTKFGLNATCADAFAIGAVVSLSLLQEYYGSSAARQAIWISFLLLIFYVLVSLILLAYQPALTDMSHEHFYHLLTFMPRVTAASFIVFLIVQYLEAALFHFLKEKTAGKLFVIRAVCSVAITQFIDTALFSLLGLYGIIDNIFQVIIVSYTIKMAALLLSTPCIALSRFFYRKPRSSTVP